MKKNYLLFLLFIGLALLAPVVAADNVTFHYPSGNASELENDYIEFNATIFQAGVDQINFTFDGSSSLLETNTTHGVCVQNCLAPSYTTSDDLLLYVDFNSENTPLVDRSDYHVAVGSRGGSYVKGFYDGSFDLTDAETSLVFLDNGFAAEDRLLLNTSKAFSTSFWFNLESFTKTTEPLLALRSASGEMWRLELSQNDSFKTISFGSPTTWGDFGFDNSSSLAGAWHHLVVSYNGSDAQNSSSYTVYLDGELQSLVDVANHSLDLEDGFFSLGGTTTDYASYFGGYQTEAHAYVSFNGLVDELQLFNVTLSAADVVELYTYPTFTKINDSAWSFQTNVTDLAYGDHNYSLSSINATLNETTSGLLDVEITVCATCNISFGNYTSPGIPGTYVTENGTISFDLLISGLGFSKVVVEQNGVNQTYLFQNQQVACVENCPVKMYDNDDSGLLYANSFETNGSLESEGLYDINFTNREAQWDAYGVFGNSYYCAGDGGNTYLLTFNESRDLIRSAWFATKNRSVSMWIKPDSFDPSDYPGTSRNYFAWDGADLIHGASKLRVYQAVDGLARFHMAFGGAYLDYYVSENETGWYHWAGVRNEDDVYFYLNGELIGQGIGTEDKSTWASLPAEPFLGHHGGKEFYYSVPSRFAQGYIDEVRFYNRSLSFEEVEDLYYSDDTTLFDDTTEEERSFVYDASSLVEGTNDIKIYAFDEFGNIATAEYDVVYEIAQEETIEETTSSSSTSSSSSRDFIRVPKIGSFNNKPFYPQKDYLVVFQKEHYFDFNAQPNEQTNSFDVELGNASFELVCGTDLLVDLQTGWLQMSCEDVATNSALQTILFEEVEFVQTQQGGSGDDFVVDNATLVVNETQEETNRSLEASPALFSWGEFALWSFSLLLVVLILAYYWWDKVHHNN